MKYIPAIYGALAGLNLGVALMTPNVINILVGLYLAFRAYQESK